MTHGYSFRQVTGPALDAKKYPSLNQDNNGGSTVGIVVDILDAERVVLTSPTYSSFEEAEANVERMLLRFQ